MGNKPQKSSKETIREEKRIEAFYSGPLPDPHSFRAYEETLPGSAERILTMAEREQEHRHNKENRLIDSEIESEKKEIRARTRDSLIGLIFAFILAMVLFYYSYLLFKEGYQAAGGTFILFGIVSLISTFISATRILAKRKQ